MMTYFNGEGLSVWTLVSSLIFVAALQQPDACSDGTAGIVVVVRGFRNEQGQGAVALFRSAKGFPSDTDKAYRKLAAKIIDRSATLQISNVPCGTYAVSALHDENSNGKIDRQWNGKPKEGYGVSRNAPSRVFSPPPFEAAEFRVDRAATKIVIDLRY